MSAFVESFGNKPVKLDQLSSIANVARFLGTPEDKVNELQEEGRLGGVLIATLRNKGIPVTPNLKNLVENVVTTLYPRGLSRTMQMDRAYLLSSEATATIMFTDIVDSTPMVERMGDRRARDVLRVHNEIIRRHTKASGGAEVKSMGDGFMLTFSSARRGLACAVAAQQELFKYSEENPDTLLSVRMGLSVGEPIREEEDLFGKSVILAARVSAKAKGHQILVCQIVHALVSSTGEFRLDALGEFELKGISGTHPLYEVLWR